MDSELRRLPSVDRLISEEQIKRHKQANVSGAAQPFRLSDADPHEGLDEFLEGIE